MHESNVFFRVTFRASLLLITCLSVCSAQCGMSGAICGTIHIGARFKLLRGRCILTGPVKNTLIFKLR